MEPIPLILKNCTNEMLIKLAKIGSGNEFSYIKICSGDKITMIPQDLVVETLDINDGRYLKKIPKNLKIKNLIIDDINLSNELDSKSKSIINVKKIINEKYDIEDLYFY